MQLNVVYPSYDFISTGLDISTTTKSSLKTHFYNCFYLLIGTLPAWFTLYLTENWKAIIYPGHEQKIDGKW